MKECGTWCTSAVTGELLHSEVHLAGSFGGMVTKLRFGLNNGTAVVKRSESHRGR